MITSIVVTGTHKIRMNSNKKIKINDNVLSVEIRSLIFILNKMYNNCIVNNLEVYNVGKCGYCGKCLETLQDIENGIHEECKSKLSLDKIIK